MATYNKFRSFVEYLADGVMNLDLPGDGGDTLTVALCAAANAPVNTNTVLANLTQIAYTNCSARDLTISASAQTAGTFKLVVDDLVLTASGGNVATFRYVVVYDNTPTSPADPLICWFDAGSDVTILSGQSYTLNFDGTNGLFTIA